MVVVLQFIQLYCRLNHAPEELTSYSFIMSLQTKLKIEHSCRPLSAPISRLRPCICNRVGWLAFWSPLLPYICNFWHPGTL